MKSIFLTICIAALAVPCFSQQPVKISECVIEKGILKTVQVDYNTATGDRTITVNGVTKKFYDVYPQEGPDYAAKSSWYINNEKITFNGANFVKYGLPRILSPVEVTKTGEYKSINVYTESGLTPQEVKDAEVIYVPVRGGCEFQPYQRQLPPCATVTLKANKQQFKPGDAITFTATVAGNASTASYEWYASPAKILGKADGKKINVSTTGLNSDLDVQVIVRTTAARCESAIEHVLVKIKK